MFQPKFKQLQLFALCFVSAFRTHLQYFKDSPTPWFPPPLPVVHRIERAQQDLARRLRVMQEWPVLWLWNPYLQVVVLMTDKLLVNMNLCWGFSCPTIFLLDCPIDQAGNINVKWVGWFKLCCSGKKQMSFNSRNILSARLCTYFVYLTCNMGHVLDWCIYRMFLSVVDVRTDDYSRYIHHIEAHVPLKTQMKQWDNQTVTVGAT